MKQFLKTILAPVLFWRIILLLVFFYGAYAIPHSIIHERTFVGNPVLSPMAQWDSNWYMDIAKKGYQYEPRSVAFFPMYPIAIRGLEMLHLKELTSVFLIGLLTVIGSAWFMLKLSAQEVGDELATKPLWLFLSFPSALFLAGAYSESIWCFLAFGAFYFHMKRQAVPAAIFSIFASATRMYGFLVGISLAFGYVLKKEWLKAFLTALVAPLGLLAYMLYLKHLTGDPLAFFHVHSDSYWTQHPTIFINRTLGTWWKDLIDPFSSHNYRLFFQNFIEISSWFFALILIILGARRLPKEWTFFAASCLAVFIFSGSHNSINRYILPLFPMYITLYRVLPRGWYTPWITGSAVMLGMLSLLYVGCYWVG